MITAIIISALFAAGGAYTYWHSSRVSGEAAMGDAVLFFICLGGLAATWATYGVVKLVMYFL